MQVGNKKPHGPKELKKGQKETRKGKGSVGTAMVRV